jgi:hypothetical protein
MAAGPDNRLCDLAAAISGLRPSAMPRSTSRHRIGSDCGKPATIRRIEKRWNAYPAPT